MAFSMQEVEMMFQGAMQSYIFNFAFESRNPGCMFDMKQWIDDLNAVSAEDELNIMNQANAEKLSAILYNLDNYAKPIEKDDHGLKLV